MRAPTKTFTRAKSLRRTMTLPEVLLWRDLRRRNAESLHVRRQHAVGPYVLDFYCSNARLGIEVDGAAHDTGAQAAHDLSRDQWLAANGIRILRYNASEILDATRRSDVIATIIAAAAAPSTAFGGPPPPLRGGG